MNNITNFVKRHPLVGYFTLAYALTWPWIPLVSVSPLWGFPAVFGPAIAAIIVAAVSEGRTGVKDLLDGASGCAGTLSPWVCPRSSRLLL